jgi:hypothetical protein
VTEVAPGDFVVLNWRGERRACERAANPGKVLPRIVGCQYFKPLRQVIESVNDTHKGQLDLEQHVGRTVAGVTVRVLQRVLA